MVFFPAKKKIVTVVGPKAFWSVVEEDPSITTKKVVGRTYGLWIWKICDEAIIKCTV